MMRVLNLDLDFFVHGVAHYRGPDHDRLDATEYSPWSLDEVMSFLEGRCGLRQKLPGFVVEHHGELFALWRNAIDEGRLEAPFHLTHVDAHADIGLGDYGYKYLMTELLFEEPENRRHPEIGPTNLADGNWLAFAIACRWISEMVYVFNEGGGNDLLTYHMENFDPLASNIELKAVLAADLDSLMFNPSRRPKVAHREPLVPFVQLPWRSYDAKQRFDVICLAQSPPFTPPGSDAIFEEIRRRFIDENF